MSEIKETPHFHFTFRCDSFEQNAWLTRTKRSWIFEAQGERKPVSFDFKAEGISCAVHWSEEQVKQWRESLEGNPSNGLLLVEWHPNGDSKDSSVEDNICVFERGFSVQLESSLLRKALDDTKIVLV